MYAPAALPPRFDVPEAGPAVSPRKTGLDPTQPLGLFAYASLTGYITALVGAPVDVVNRHTVKTLLRETIGCEAVDVF